MDSLNINRCSSRTWLRIVTDFAHGHAIESYYSLMCWFSYARVCVCVCAYICIFGFVIFSLVIISTGPTSGSRLLERPMTHLLMRTLSVFLTHIAGPWIHIQGSAYHRRLHNAFKNLRHRSRDGYMGQEGIDLTRVNHLSSRRVIAAIYAGVGTLNLHTPYGTSQRQARGTSMMSTCHISSAWLNHGWGFQLCFVPEGLTRGAEF